MNAAEGTTMIGKSVRITGELSGSEDLVMEGEVTGIIRLPGGRLIIGRDGRVHGDVVAKDVVVLGFIEGDIRATGRAEVRSSAIVQGNIFAASLSMEENAMFRGQVDPTRAQEPMPERPAGGLAAKRSNTASGKVAGDANTSGPLFGGNVA